MKKYIILLSLSLSTFLSAMDMQNQGKKTTLIKQLKTQKQRLKNLKNYPQNETVVLSIKQTEIIIKFLEKKLGALEENNL